MEELANWANIATIASLFIGGVALIFQVMELAHLTPKDIAQKPWFNNIRRSLPFIILAIFFFWVGTIYSNGISSRFPSSPANDGLSPIKQISQTATLIVPTPQVDFFDDFDNGFKKPGWEIVSGTWIKNDGVPYLRNGDAGMVIVGNPDWDNFALDVELLVPGSLTGCNVIFAYKVIDDKPQYSFLYFDAYSGIYLFIKGENGNSDFVPTGKYLKEINYPFHIHLEVQGDTVKLLINDEEIYFFEDLQQSFAGPVGLRTTMYESNLQFDNFSVSKLGSK